MEIERRRNGVLSGQEVLNQTAKLVGAGWCQEADARDAAGVPVAAVDPAAIAWSLLGALVVVFELPGVELPAFTDALAGIANVISDSSLSAWNDRPGRTQTQTLDMLEQARQTIDPGKRPKIRIH